MSEETEAIIVIAILFSPLIFGIIYFIYKMLKND